jgi:hypothetical protein
LRWLLEQDRVNASEKRRCLRNLGLILPVEGVPVDEREDGDQSSAPGREAVVTNPNRWDHLRH